MACHPPGGDAGLLHGFRRDRALQACGKTWTGDLRETVQEQGVIKMTCCAPFSVMFAIYNPRTRNSAAGIRRNFHKFPIPNKRFSCLLRFRNGQEVRDGYIWDLHW